MYPVDAAAEIHSKCRCRAGSPFIKRRGVQRVLGKTALSQILGCILHAEHAGWGSPACKLAAAGC